jgi:methylase of polypeptide subunit release factors
VNSRPPSCSSTAPPTPPGAQPPARRRPPRTPRRTRSCLEIGAGSGYVICSAALALRPWAPACRFLATDVNPAAIAATGATLAAHGVEGVRLVLTDLIAGLEAELRGGVDLLVCASGLGSRGGE